MGRVQKGVNLLDIGWDWKYFEGRKVKNKSGHVVPACDVVVSNFLCRSDDDKTREIEEGYNRKQDDARKEKRDQDKRL